MTLSRRVCVSALFFCFAIGLLLTAGEAAAKIAVIKTKDGGVFEGELVRQTSTQIIINVGGIEATFDQERVASVTFRDSPQDIYDRKRKALADNDFSGRLDLAQEMYDLDALSLARFELNDLDRDFPNNVAVADLLSLVEAKFTLQQTQGTARPNRPQRDRERPNRSGRGGDVDATYLNEEQINLIKVYEVDLGEEPRISIPDEVLDEFFDKYGDNRMVPVGRRERSDFRRQSGYEQLDLFFQVQARDLYSRVEIREEPEPLSRFRRTINPRYVVKYFAPTFGRGQVPGLELLTDRPDSEQAAYTNFYRLTQFTYEGQPMIDRNNPERSLLLQWGLERDAARLPAPDIEGWRPEFNSPDDSAFQQHVEWIMTLFPDEQDYGITFNREGDDQGP